jgi:hypothetical protein
VSALSTLLDVDSCADEEELLEVLVGDELDDELEDDGADEVLAEVEPDVDEVLVPSSVLAVVESALLATAVTSPMVVAAAAAAATAPTTVALVWSRAGERRVMPTTIAVCDQIALSERSRFPQGCLGGTQAVSRSRSAIGSAGSR